MRIRYFEFIEHVLKTACSEIEQQQESATSVREWRIVSHTKNTIVIDVCVVTWNASFSVWVNVDFSSGEITVMT